MKITKEKWNSKAYRWISVIMVLLLVLAPVGVFGVKVKVKAENQTLTGSNFTLEPSVYAGYYTISYSQGGTNIMHSMSSSASDTITIVPEGDSATLTIDDEGSSGIQLSSSSIVCSDGINVVFENGSTASFSGFTASGSVNLGTSGVLEVYTANLNNTTGGSIVVTGGNNRPGNLKLTGTNTDVVVSVSESNMNAVISSEGNFTLNVEGVRKSVTGPANEKVGELMGYYPTIDDLSGKDFYVGAEYNLANYAHFPEGYTSDQFRFDYLLSASIIGQTMPTAPGNYEVIVTGPSGSSSPCSFTVKYLSAEDVEDFEVSEVDENGYVYVYAPNGWAISKDNEIYSPSLRFTEAELYPEEGMFNESLNVYVKITSGEHNGARSDALSYSDVAPGLDEVNFHPEEVIPNDDDEEEIIPDDEEEEVVPEEEEEKEEEKEEEPKEEEKKEEVKPADESGHSGKTDNTSNTTSVSKPSPNITLTLDDQLYGLSYAPSFKSDSTGSVKYLYSVAGENKFSETKPTEPGKYICRVVQEGTEKFGQGTKDVNFSILYLAAPTDAYSISGKKGNNGYYVSDVYLTAPDGYSISLTLNGTYEDKVQVSDKTKYIYLKRKSDGAMTDGIGIKEGIKVDAKAPVVSGKATDVDGNEVALGGKIYTDKVSFKMADEHLSKVTVNGEEVTVKDGAADISLDANNRHMVYKISAEDEAGNIFTFTVDVYAPWMESGVIPAGVKVGLEAGSTYKLEDGEWATDVDSTVYTGGMDFYVAEDMELTFIKVK